MKLYLARHCRTNYNDLELCNGDPSVDVHLTEVGETQASGLAEKLKSAKIDQIYVSQHKRTQQTAAFVNKFHGAAVVIDARLNDIRTGFEGKPAAEYDAALTGADQKWTARFNDGESVEDMNKRVRAFMTELKTHQHEAVLIITSKVVVQALYGVLNDVSNEEAWSLEVEQGGFITFTS